MPQVALSPQDKTQPIAYATTSGATSSHLREHFADSMINSLQPSSYSTLAVDKTSFLKGPLIETLFRIYQLRSWKENWNSYQVKPPDPRAVASARSWMISFFQTIEDLDLPWLRPGVAADEEGEVAFEWWYKEKKLTIYVASDHIDYVQVWGTDIKATITDGEIESLSDFRSLWIWLTRTNHD